MRASHLFAPTLREAPADEEIASAQLLLRAGYVRKVMAGAYTLLPLGFRVLRKIETIIREEMDASGAQEVRMPIVLPAEPWMATGRWDLYGELLFRLKDRHGRDLLLGPTQEEVVTPLVAGDVPSYRDLPVNLYQVEWKYRDEFRPRYGLLRGREFLMKDAYSFDADDDGMRRSYEVMYRAYERIFDRLRLSYVTVEADPGQIGGGVNHEFMARADVGEDLFVECENGDYLADVEAARPLASAAGTEPTEEIREVSTPGATTIEAVSRVVERDPSTVLKCLIYTVGDRPIAVLLPGDRELSEPKLERLYFPTPVRRFEDDDFERAGLVKGFVGPQGLPEDVEVLADHTVRAGHDWVAGANRADVHATGVNVDRDFRVDRWEDLVEIREGDRCPNDGGRLRIGRSIVVGHIYQLGTKYSEPLKATFVAEDGMERPYVMGCYGIGLSRIIAAAAEQFHDEAGLAWPRVLAPFQATVIPTNMDREDVVAAAERLYEDLRSRGVDAVLDDRQVSAGVKFADADLVGYPLQVIAGARGLERGALEIKTRATGDRRDVPADAGADAILEVLGTLP